MAEQLKVIIFVGSVREGRSAERAYKYVKKVLETYGCAVTVFDPKVMPFPLLQQPIHFYPDQSKAPQYLQDANEQLKQADAVVFVTGEYNRTIPPALTNVIDHFSPSTYAWKSVLTVSYSSSQGGGVYAATALLPVCREFGLLVTPTAVNIPSIGKALDADGQLQAGFEFIQSSMDLSVSQLVFLANAMKHAKADKSKVPKVQSYV